jgi:hypothetical protein
MPDRRAVPEDGLDEEGEEKEQAKEPGGDAQHDQVGTRPVTVGEHPDRQQRTRTAQLGKDEQYEQHDGRGQ